MYLHPSHRAESPTVSGLVKKVAAKDQVWGGDPAVFVKGKIERSISETRLSAAAAAAAPRVAVQSRLRCG